MTAHQRHLLALLALAFGLTSCGDSTVATPSPTTDVNGVWDARFERAETPLPPGFTRATMTLQQSGPDVGGTIQFESGAAAPLGGSVNGLVLSFISDIPVNGGTARLTVTASQLSPTLLSGSFRFTGGGLGTGGIFEANPR